MTQEQPAEIIVRHEAQRGAALTARERQDWQDVETLLAEARRVRALLAGVVAEFPGDVRSAALDAARDYLAKTADEQGA